MITVEAYLSQHTGHEAELTDELRANAQVTVDKANQLLTAFGEARGLRSGWRPQAVNNATPHAAHHSAHITCQAIDLDDEDKRLQEWCAADKGANLVPFGLYMEHPIATPSWTHIQIIPPGTGLRVFYPNAAWAARAREEGLA